MLTRRHVALVIFLAAVVLFVWYQGRTVVPDGQPPLVTLDASAMLALRSDFNRHADATRVIILLSPT